ncbi:AEC family transporter [Ottowia sp.]|uniref:AEC family transporter n=1 Tax=Ottowia sp. TaxID=1898956 RepID=UPI0025E9AC8F|nr:AEC family transporter [Ottowia sp.]
MRDAQLLLPDFSLILVGYLLCRFTALDRPVWQAVERLVYFFLFPVFLFQSIVRTPLDLHAASTLIGAGLALMGCGIAMAWSLPWLPGLRRVIDVREHAASAQIAFRFNSFIGLAMAERVLGAPGQQLVAVLVGVSVPLANVAAVWPMARHGQRSFAAEVVRNPLIIATAAGLAANLAGLALPDWLQTTLGRIGGSSIALGLLTAGAGMQLASLARGKALGTGVLAIRHALQPLAAWLLARAFGLGAAETTALLIFSALPTSSSCYVLAARMGYNGAFVAGLVTLSTVLGLASLSGALQLAGAR